MSPMLKKEFVISWPRQGNGASVLPEWVKKHRWTFELLGYPKVQRKIISE